MFKPWLMIPGSQAAISAPNGLDIHRPFSALRGFFLVFSFV
jgi:hypothetical protein